jgi:hypothetical protein
MKFKEDDLQMAVAKYLDLQGILWCHVANERNTSFVKGARLKKKGVKSGVPDCLIFEPRGLFYSGLAIELKIKPNKVSINQKEWLTSLKNNKWCVGVAYSFDEAKDIIDKYLKL